MQTKHIKTVLIILLVLIVLSLTPILILKFTEDSYGDFFRSDTISQTQLTKLQERLRIKIPSSFKFRECWHSNSIDPSNFYIYEIDLSQIDTTITVDAYIRTSLGIDPILYSDTIEAGGSIYDDELSSVGYNFTNRISFMTDGFCQIYYLLENETTAIIALCYSTV